MSNTATAAITAATLGARIVIKRAEFTVDVDVSLLAGESLALMGPSGAGKTTILDGLSGLTKLDTGRIVLGGDEVADSELGIHTPPSQRRVGRLGQDTELFPHMSVQENIAFAIRVQGIKSEEALALANDWLQRIGLASLSQRMPSQLSGGQAKRVALARALAARPRLLLVDEPFSSLDVEAAADMRELLANQLKEHPTTMVLVSHDARDALTLAQRMVVIELGQIVQQGTVREVLDAPKTRFVKALAATA